MSLIEGQFVKKRLDEVRESIWQQRESLHYARLRGVWTEGQLNDLYALLKSISDLELVVANLILDNKPTAQQKRP